MRYLIVNADDFGASPGVNEGIVEAHRRGIVTSASLMIGMPGSDAAARLAHECSELSVGLHAVIPNQRGGGPTDSVYLRASRAALEDQLSAFTELVGRLPTHLDSHHHVHPRPGLVSHFRKMAERCEIPLRALSGVGYCSRFYGQWGGDTHPEQVSAANLVHLLGTEISKGVTELSCHPGLLDPALDSSYALERELELRSLCDRRVHDFIERSEIALVGFADVPHLLGATA